MKQTVIQAISSQLSRMDHAIKMQGPFDRDDTAYAHHETNIRDAALCLEQLEKEFLPGGSGFDNGSVIDMDRSTPSKIVINTSYHHMDEGGSYCEWSDHTLTVRPAFCGVALKVGGRNVRDIKDYMHETFDHSLSQLIDWSFSSVHGSTFNLVNRGID